MRVDEDRAFPARVYSTFAIVFASLCLLVAPSVYAQEDSDDAAEEERVVEEVIVTGSRLKRSTYSSISPLQIITAQVSREVGLIDAADILQESTAASGQQIDLTFQGFVLDNGPGATTINLRGLGAARTLVLINGRRLSPAGVEGAPVSPDLNFVPASLVQQYDLLLDGASSVYGSDAIAGVANVILRKDFDGIEIETYSRVPDQGAGIDHTLSAVWGHNWDRGYIAIGGEYTDHERVTFDDRSWTSGCNQHHEIDENGQFRFQEQFYNAPASNAWNEGGDRNGYGMTWDECKVGLLASRVFVITGAGSIYYTPGVSNGGWGNFSESSSGFVIGGIPVRWGADGDGDGNTDLSFRDYSLNGKDNASRDLFPENQTQNFMAFGEYTFASEANITPYFEVLYAKRDFLAHSRNPQFFPVVPADNPYNLCNPLAITGNGVDCGLAEDAYWTNPNVVAQFQTYLGSFCTLIGLPIASCTPANLGLLQGPSGSLLTQPIVSVQGDRNTVSVTADQTRVVLGVGGDLPFLNAGSLDNWSFDVYGSYSISTGESHRVGIREDRLDQALGWNSSTTTPCVNDLGVELEPDVEPGCVPINMFAASLYPVGGVIGDFATQAERDYLFDSRDFDTEYEQTIFSAYMTGNIFELPAGNVALGFGVEYRDDEITSIPDAVARDGLFFGFFSDGGAVGSKTTKEVFAEIELPLLAGAPAFQELTVNLSTRRTDDEIYGAQWTESFKLGWRPVESLLIRATVGTAFRAPNLRELYLLNQTGFGSIFDPCYIPEAAWDSLNDVYIPGSDTRDPTILANCLAQGVDPTLAYNGGFNVFSTEQSQGGSLTLLAEESESWSAGFAWDLPFTNAYDLAISATYYEIEVNNTIIEPSGQFIVNDCYQSSTGTSVFCDRITRDLTDPMDPRIDLIDEQFLNRDNETARGVDINVAFDDTWTIFSRPIDFSADLIANRQLERSTLFTNDDGVPDAQTFQGEWGFPPWRVQAFLRFDYDDFRVTWETRYTGSVHQKTAQVESFSDAFALSDTCLGPPTDVLCRDYADADNYYLHNISLYYYGDSWTLGGGVRNLLDEAPPRVDTSTIGAPTAVNNTPLGYGYDLNGRVYFFNVAFKFGGGE